MKPTQKTAGLYHYITPNKLSIFISSMRHIFIDLASIRTCYNCSPFWFGRFNVYNTCLLITAGWEWSGQEPYKVVWMFSKMYHNILGYKSHNFSVILCVCQCKNNKEFSSGPRYIAAFSCKGKTKYNVCTFIKPVAEVLVLKLFLFGYFFQIGLKWHGLGQITAGSLYRMYRQHELLSHSPQSKTTFWNSTHLSATHNVCEQSVKSCFLKVFLLSLMLVSVEWCLKGIRVRVLTSDSVFFLPTFFLNFYSKCKSLLKSSWMTQHSLWVQRRLSQKKNQNHIVRVWMWHFNVCSVSSVTSKGLISFLNRQR